MLVKYLALLVAVDDERGLASNAIDHVVLRDRRLHLAGTTALKQFRDHRLEHILASREPRAAKEELLPVVVRVLQREEEVARVCPARPSIGATKHIVRAGGDVIARTILQQRRGARQQDRRPRAAGFLAELGHAVNEHAGRADEADVRNVDVSFVADRVAHAAQAPRQRLRNQPQQLLGRTRLEDLVAQDALAGEQPQVGSESKVL